MNELERHEAAANRSTRDKVDAVAGRTRADIGDATEKAKAALRDTRQSAEAAYDDVRSQAQGVYSQARAKVSDLRRNAPNSPEAARETISNFIETNPAMVAVVGLAAGLIVGALIPGTRREDEMFGRYADDAKDQGLRYARDLVEQGKHYVEETFEQARDGAAREPA